MQITNGTVEFTTPRPFEAKSARVSLTFMVADGEDAEAVAATVGEIAQRRALAMVGGEMPKPVRVASGPRKAAGAAAALIIDDNSPGAAIVDDAFRVMLEDNKEQNAALIVDDVEQAPAPAPKPLMSGDITAACGHATTRGVPAAKVHALIAEYGGKVKDVPPEKYEELLKKLKELKA